MEKFILNVIVNKVKIKFEVFGFGVKKEVGHKDNTLIISFMYLKSVIYYFNKLNATS